MMVFADCTRASNIRWLDALQAGEPLRQEAEDKMARGMIMCRYRQVTAGARSSPASNEIRRRGGKLLAQVPCEPAPIVWGC